MTTSQTLILCCTLTLCVLVAAVVIVYAITVPTRRQAAPSRVGQRVNVHTKQPDYQLVCGVITQEWADRIRLEQAEYVTANGVTALQAPQDIATCDIGRVEIVPHRDLALAARDREATAA